MKLAAESAGQAWSKGHGQLKTGTLSLYCAAVLSLAGNAERSSGVGTLDAGRWALMLGGGNELGAGSKRGQRFPGCSPSNTSTCAQVSLASGGGAEPVLEATTQGGLLLWMRWMRCLVRFETLGRVLHHLFRPR